MVKEQIKTRKQETTERKKEKERKKKQTKNNNDRDKTHPPTHLKKVMNCNFLKIFSEYSPKTQIASIRFCHRFPSVSSKCIIMATAWKESKYGVISGPYLDSFHAVGSLKLFLNGFQSPEEI